MKKAFTMIELVFVIVILGVLAAVAVPKFSGATQSAQIAKAKNDVATIRSAILTERQGQLIKGINSFIPKLSDNSDLLFMGDGTRKLLMYGIKSGTTSGKWSADDAGYKNYTFHFDSEDVAFTYDNNTGVFSCDRAASENCRKLID